jgi:kynurenine formamidase
MRQLAQIDIDGIDVQIDLAAAHSLALPLQFDGHQPQWFAAPAPSSVALETAGFTGSVARGASCNCHTLHFTPHCDGTHTECVGHLTAEPCDVQEVAPRTMLPAAVITQMPISAAASGENSDPPARDRDLYITRNALLARWPQRTPFAIKALIIRTLPNPADKRSRDYHQQPAAYFSREAMELVVARGIEHLVLDLPSCDRADDQGRLCAHRIFFGLPPGSTALADARRAQCTLTELAFIDNAIVDGCYLLNLQLPSIAGDALPSRPLLYPPVGA